MLNLGAAAVFSDQSMQGQSEKKKSDKQQRKAPGVGPMGEVEKGGGGPSGPKTKKAPGLEGAGGKKSGQSPTGGGH